MKSCALGIRAKMLKGYMILLLILSLSFQSNEIGSWKWHLHGKAVGLQGEHGTDTEFHI